MLAVRRFVPPYGVCMRCGFKRRVNRLRKEFTGLRVCTECWDARPPDTRPPRVTPEGLPVPNASPEPAIVERDPPVTGQPDEDDL